MEPINLKNRKNNSGELSIPKVILLSNLNDVAIEHITKKTGIKIKKTPFNSFEFKITSIDQFLRLMKTYNYAYWYENNHTNKDTIFLRHFDRNDEIINPAEVKMLQRILNRKGTKEDYSHLEWIKNVI